jgi:hypothetical protein
MVKGKVLFNTYLAPRVAEKLRGAAKAEGKTYSDWLEEIIKIRVKHLEAVTGKRIKPVKARTYKIRKAA